MVNSSGLNEVDGNDGEAVFTGEITKQKSGDQSKECAPRICPRCKRGVIEINGLLECYCLVCGYREPGGGYT